MLCDTAELRALRLNATDGAIGKIDDVYFSDDTWTIRYLVVDTGGWLSGRKVLVSPHAVQRLDFENGELALDISREQVTDSPDWDSDKPISRQFEAEYSQYYGYPFYWSGPYLWGAAYYPVPPGSPVGEPREHSENELRERMERSRARSDPHLRSARAVSGYTLEATDGGIGHIETFLFDDAAWAIAAIVVDTRNWWPGKHVVISPDWIVDIDWDSRSARVDATRERVQSRAEFDPHALRTSPRHSLAERIRHALHLGE